jgi:hypothetical protein
MFCFPVRALRWSFNARTKQRHLNRVSIEILLVNENSTFRGTYALQNWLQSIFLVTLGHSEKQCCGSESGIRYRTFLTSGSGIDKNQDPDPGSGSGMDIPDHISKSLETNFWLKILKILLCASGYGIWNLFDPGSGKEKIRIRDKHPGSETLQ